MTNTEKLNIAIIKAKKTKKELANSLELSEMGFYKKVQGITEFKASEIGKLQTLLCLTPLEMTEIFFT